MKSGLFEGRPVRVGVILVVLGMALLIAGNVAAQEDRPEVRMTVQGGINGWVDPYWPTRLQVRIEADVLLVGQLQVVQRQELARLEVEVPAGGVRTYEVVVEPPVELGAILFRVIPQGSDDEQPVATAFFRPRLADREILVGVVGVSGLEEVLGETRSAMSDDPIVPLGIDTLSDRLETGEFHQLSYLVLGQPRPLPAATVSWLRAGGRLITTASALDAMELHAQPWGSFPGVEAPVGWYGVGRGEVLALDHLAGHDPQVWATLIRPSHPWTSQQPRLADMSSSLTQSALAVETDTPQYSWLPWVVIGYAVLIGPVNLWVLRRRRRLHWAWVTIPLAGLAGVVAFWLVGSAGVNQTFWSHGTVQVGGENSQARSAIVAATSRAQNLEVSFDPGWDVFAENLRDLARDTAQPTIAGTGVHQYELPALGWMSVNAFRREGPTGLAVEFSEESIRLTNNSASPVLVWGVHAFPKTELADPVDSGASGSVTWEAVLASDSYWSLGDAFWEPNTSQRLENWSFNWPSAVTSMVDTARSSQMIDVPTFAFAVVEGQLAGVQVEGRSAPVSGLTLVLFPIAPDQMGQKGWAHAGMIWRDGDFLTELGDDDVAFGVRWLLSYRLPSGLSTPPRMVLRGLDPDFWGFDAEPEPAFGEGGGADGPGWEAWDWNSARFVSVNINQPLDQKLVAASGEVILRVTSLGDEFSRFQERFAESVMMWGEQP